jgi:RNA polymerase sigma-70 factor (ECF subfamily)
MPQPTESFERLYAKHQALVRRLLLERGVPVSDLEDVVQETFVIVHRLLPEFEGRSSIETWLYAIVRRVAANHRRKRRAEAGEPSVEMPDDEVDEPSLIPERVFESLSQVDDDSRDLLALHEIGGISISSLAEMTGNARATIRERLSRGEASLTRALTRRNEKPAQEGWLETLTARFEHPPAPIPPGELRVMPCKKTCISTLGNVVIAMWRGPASNEALQVVIENMIAIAHAYPEGMRYLCVVEGTSTPPTREGRAMITWVAKKLGTRVKAAGSAVEGAGLMSLVPALMNTCLFLARSPVNQRFFRDLDTTLEWMAQYGELDVRAVKAIIERMRASLDPVAG